MTGQRSSVWQRIIPARTVPHTRWRSEGSRWRTRPSTFAVLITGLWVFGTAEALFVNASLGVAPWTVFAQGLAVHLPITIGLATFLTSITVLLMWIPLRERPGLGTISNAVVIAVALQVMVLVVPRPHAFLWQLAQVILGLLLCGLGSALYLTTNLGPGPRDGLMTGIHERTGWPVTAIRLSIEVAVLFVGWLLGGTVGLGTVLFAVLIGFSVGYNLRLVGWLAGPSGEPDDVEDIHPELEA